MDDVTDGDAGAGDEPGGDEPGGDEAAEGAFVLPDMGSLLGMAAEMQQQMAAAQEGLAAQVLEGQSGGGVVRIRATADLRFLDVAIEPEVVDPDDVDLLEDLVLAALHDVADRAYALQQQSVGVLGGLDLASVDLGGLGEMLGLVAGAEDDDEDDSGDDDEDDSGDDGGGAT